MRRALGAALVVALVVTGSALPASAKTDSSLASRVAAVNAVLQARAAAQVGHDRAAYEATIDPHAPKPFHDAQMAAYDGLASLPVKSLTYKARTDLVGDLTRAVNANEYGGAPVLLVETSRELTFDHFDERPGLDDMFWTYVQRGDKWYVGGDDDALDLGLETTTSIWDTAPVTTVTSDHFLVITHPELAERANAVMGLVESALTVLGQRWTLPWSTRLVVFIPSSPDELAKLIQSTVDVTKFVAFVSYTLDPDTLKGTSPRLYLQDTNLTKYTADGQVETLVHELTHAAGSVYASGFIPSWVHEGLADWVAGGTNQKDARDRGAGTSAPRDDQFGAGSQSDIIRAYKDARSLIAVLARVAGTNAPFALFKGVGENPVQPGAQDYVLDRALQALGVPSLVALQDDWVGGR